MRRTSNQKETGAIIAMVDQIQLELDDNSEWKVFDRKTNLELEKSTELLTDEEREWITWLVFPHSLAEIHSITFVDCIQEENDKTPEMRYIKIYLGFGMDEDEVYSCRFIASKYFKYAKSDYKYSGQELGL